MPADWLDPFAQAAEVAAARRLIRQRSLVAAELERTLLRLGAASRHGQSVVNPVVSVWSIERSVQWSVL